MVQNFIGQQQWPENVVMPGVPQTIAEWVMGGFVVLMILWGIRNLIVRRDQSLLICMIAGAATCVMEPHLMYLYRFFYPQIGQHVFLYGFGHPIPVFLMFCYSAFFGPAAYLFLVTDLARSFSLKGFIIGIGALVATEILLEVVCVHFGVWLYFANQPFTIGNVPLHVPVVVACGCLILGSVSRVWFVRVSGLRQWLMVLLCPMLMIGVFSVCAYPVAFALQSGYGLAATRIGSLATILIALVMSYECAKRLAVIPNGSDRPA